MIAGSRRGRSDETESEDLPVKIHVLFFGTESVSEFGTMPFRRQQCLVSIHWIKTRQSARGADRLPPELHFCFGFPWLGPGRSNLVSLRNLQARLTENARASRLAELCGIHLEQTPKNGMPLLRDGQEARCVYWILQFDRTCSTESQTCPAFL